MKKTRNQYNKYYWPIIVLFILGGLFYNPAIGLIAIICMVAPVVMAIFNGRMWCGRFCPRGSFFDQILTRVGAKNRKVPEFLKKPVVRWTVFTGLMAYMSYNMYLTGGDILAIGRVLFNMILLTSVVGITLGYFYGTRSWCKICPMGTLAMVTTRGIKKPVQVSSSCKSCGICAKSCPFDISVDSYKASGEVDDPDCIKCGVCVTACPVNALQIEESLGLKETEMNTRG